MKRTYIKDLSSKKGEEVLIKGWVNVRRDQGKMIFLDFRDMTGLVQGVILPNQTEALEIGKQLRQEFVIEVNGKVNERPERNRKTGVLNGDIELEILKINILNESDVLPFPIDGDTREVDENIRLKHRYLDLRNSRMQKNMRNRFAIQQHIRNFLQNESFTEVEYEVVNVSQLNDVTEKEITLESLAKAGIISRRAKWLKVLGDGEITKAVSIKAHAVSETAKQKLEKAGGKIELLEVK